MRKFLALAVVCMLFMQMQCEDEKQEDIICIPPGCSTPATVRNRIDSGCYYLLELNDGTLLAPYIIGYCGTPPLPANIPQEPLHTVDLKEGLKVVIDFEPAPEQVIKCADKTVRITCIHAVGQEEDEPDTH